MLPVRRLKKSSTTYPVTGFEKANCKKYMLGKMAKPNRTIRSMSRPGCA